MNAYMASVVEQVKKRNAGEPEFIQTVEEVFHSIEKVVEAHPEYEKAFEVLNLFLHKILRLKLCKKIFLRFFYKMLRK